MGVPSSTSSTSSFVTPSSSSSSYLSPIEAAAGHRPVPPAILPSDHPQSATSPSTPPGDPSPFHLFPSRHQLPRVIFHFNPDVKIKLRKRFYPLGLTRLTLGADLDVRNHDVSFKWSWRDRLFGGRLEFFGNQIALTKRFDIDTRSKLDVRAAYDLHQHRTLFSLSIRPFGGVVANDGPPAGVRLRKRVSVDRHLAVELAGKLSVPEARFSNENTTALSLGDGDFVFDLDQLNFRFSLQ